MFIASSITSRWRGCILPRPDSRGDNEGAFSFSTSVAETADDSDVDSIDLTEAFELVPRFLVLVAPATFLALLGIEVQTCSGRRTTRPIAWIDERVSWIERHAGDSCSMLIASEDRLWHRGTGVERGDRLWKRGMTVVGASFLVLVARRRDAAAILKRRDIRGR